MNSGELREILRSGTACDHARLDRLVARFDLSCAAGYRALLRLHATVLLPIEQWLERHGVTADLPDWDDRKRVPALLDDLARLGMEPPEEGARARFEHPATPATRSGVLYVLEGSRLGGAVLVRRLADDRPGLPTSFLRHGSDRSLWPSFVRWLNRREFDADETGIALRSARQVFDTYRGAIEGALTK